MDTGQELGRAYRPRIIDLAVQRALEAAGAVVIEGARASGKTMTALNAARSYAFVDDPRTRQLLEIAPEALLEGERPRLLDEWQVAPDIWNLVRRAVDRSESAGQYLLTGSALPADDITRHTGAGRLLRLRQRTMSWHEKRDGEPGRVSLMALFDGERPAASTGGEPAIESVIDGIVQPGFPAMTALDHAQSAQRLRGYIDEIAGTDVRRLSDVRHGPDAIRQLIRSLARSTASEVTYATLAKDLRATAPGISAETTRGYVELLERLFVVEAQLPWAPALRSRARLRRSPKLHLVDPSLAAVALGAGPEALLADLETLGLLFESAVVHDLLVLASAQDGEVRHYRNSNGKEIDAIVMLPDGRWGAVEIKLGGGQISAGMASLRAAIEEIDTSVVGEPAFMLVVSGTGPVLTAGDGTVTCSLGDLAP